MTGTMKTTTTGTTMKTMTMSDNQSGESREENMSEQTPYEQGYCVHDRGENPYPEGSPDATEWQRGWDQAERETDGYADR